VGLALIIEIHLNGKIQIELRPETPIESLVLSEMLEGAAKGKAVTLTSGGDGRYLVAVEK
jgi:hypothetical protein